LAALVPANESLQAEQAGDMLSEVRNDLEGLAAELDSLEDLARFLAMEVQGGGHSEAAGTFFSIMNLTQRFKQDANALVDRLMAIERAERACGEARP
jgi:oligoribonuclease NrnB/cAMP/cGMP phosphodiesterase (DHH superfamily)